jgi:hypothetical protein
MFLAFLSGAQPVLPDIAGVENKGTVTLSWQCQYNTVKAISVLRANDSMSDYSLIGFVDKTEKGIQTFTDTQPAPGKNCYKLAIEFKTGLMWRSNFYCLKVEKYMLESDKQLMRKTDTVKTAVAESKAQQSSSAPETVPATPLLKLKMPPIPSDTIDNTATNVKSLYFSVDQKTGNIILMLPGNEAKDDYSLKFFDLQGNLITEVPQIGSKTLIFDKRNFRRKKIIHFLLRKDGVEAEEGYLKKP